MPDSNTIPFIKNTLYYGDCLEVMGQWPDRCVDLIYLDPPFNSNVNHNILYKNQRPKDGNADDLAQITAFADTDDSAMHRRRRQHGNRREKIRPHDDVVG